MKKLLSLLLIFFIGFSSFGQTCNADFSFTPDTTTQHANCATMFFTDLSTASGNITSVQYDFGENNGNSTASTSAGSTIHHNFSSSNTFNVCQTITTSDGCTSTVCKPVTINCSPCRSGFTFVDSCPNFTFTDTTSRNANNQALSTVWDFGDGTSASGTVVNHSFAANGSYTVCLTVTTSNCTFTECKTLNVTCVNNHPGCQADFSAITNCDTAYFTNLSSSSDSITSYQWSFGDGTGSNLENPTHVYPGDGNYNAALTIVTASGCISTLCNNVSINCSTPPPTCNAAFSFNTNCDSVSFSSTSQSSSQIISMNWSFGDGTSGSGSNPSHQYASNGTYNVCLTIQTADSCVSMVCSTVTVNCGPPAPCQADFILTHWNGGASCDSIRVEDISQTNGLSYTITFDFGDGNVATVPGTFWAASHRYTSPGTYVVCITIETVDSCVSTKCDTVVITCGNTPPVGCQADFSISSVNCPTYDFTDQSVLSPGTTASYNWSFGDGNFSSQANPTHTYTNNGYYHVSLSITTSDSCTSTYLDSIYVNCITGPTCSATWGTTSNCEDFNFINNSTASPGNIISYHWDFGDGTTSSLATPSHSYNALGTYSITLTIVTSDSCTSSFTNTRNVFCMNSTPTCNAFITYADSCDSPTFYANAVSSSGQVVSYAWDFGDGNTSAQASPIHTYAANGNYIVCVTITSSDSCVDTDCDTISINCQNMSTNGNELRSILYPNPSSGETLVEFENLQGEVQIFLVNAIGQQVSLGTFNTKQVQLNLSSHPKGRYQVLVQSEDQLIQHPLILN